MPSRESEMQLKSNEDILALKGNSRDINIPWIGQWKLHEKSQKPAIPLAVHDVG